MIQKEIPVIKWWLFSASLLFGCRLSSDAPDISHIDINLPLYHLEDKIWNLDTTDLRAELDTLFVEHPDFSDVFFNQILTYPGIEMSPVINTITFLRDPDMRKLYSSVSQEFPDFAQFERDFVRAMQYYKYYFPDAVIPAIYTCVTGLGVGAFSIGEEILGIGLEFYLGEDYSMYDPQLFPSYIRRTMNPDHLVAKTMQALLEAKVGETSGIRMLDFMIRNGKVLYLKEKIMPFVSDTVILEFTPGQITWLKEHERQIWAHFLESELLYSTDYRKFQKLITPSPNVPNMPPETPGRAGNWIGLQIIRSFMARNSEVSLEKLLYETDAQSILARSRYKPEM